MFGVGVVGGIALVLAGVLVLYGLWFFVRSLFRRDEPAPRPRPPRPPPPPPDEPPRPEP